jgi:hypothetical protein
VFFSEEKNQKTFESALVRTYPAMAGMHTPAPKQEPKAFLHFGKGEAPSWARTAQAVAAMCGRRK